MKKRIVPELKSSLRNRLYTYFTLLMLIPVVLLGLILYRESDRRLSESALRGAETEMQRAAGGADKVIQDVLNMIRLISADETLQSLSTEEQADTTSDQLEMRLDSVLKSLNQSYDDISGCYLMLDSGLRGKSRYYSYLDRTLIPRTKLKTVHDSSGIQWIRGLNGSLITDNMGSGVLTALAGYTNAETGEVIGIIAVETGLKLFQDLLDVELGDGGNIYICDTLGNVEAGRIKDASQVSLVQSIARREIVSSGIKVIDEGAYFSLVGRLDANGWLVIGLMNKEFLRENGRDILGLTLLIFAIFAAMNVLIANALCEYELVPIRILQRYVRDVEKGNFGRELERVRDDEIGDLTDNVREMSCHIGMLMRQIREDEKTLRRTEYKALQAQIQPHFLYNTLDSISWLIWKQDNEKAYKMLTALTSFFRISLSRGAELIPVEKELEHAKSYLTIQKIRFSNLFEYQVYFEESLKGVLVPKLILQPLIENALYHGIKECERVNLLLVNVLREGEKLICEVRDDGLGIPEEILAQLNSGVFDSETAEEGGYGLKNISDRIHIFAGEEYGLHFESERNLGTSVRIVLPTDLKDLRNV